MRQATHASRGCAHTVVYAELFAPTPSVFFGHAFQHVGDNLIDRRLRGHGSRRGLAEQPEALAAAVVGVADGGVRRDQLAEQPLESTRLRRKLDV